MLMLYATFDASPMHRARFDVYKISQNMSDFCVNDCAITSMAARLLLKF